MHVPVWPAVWRVVTGSVAWWPAVWRGGRQCGVWWPAVWRGGRQCGARLCLSLHHCALIKLSIHLTMEALLRTTNSQLPVLRQQHFALYVALWPMRVAWNKAAVCTVALLLQRPCAMGTLTHAYTSPTTEAPTRPALLTWRTVSLLRPREQCVTNRSSVLLTATVCY